MSPTPKHIGELKDAHKDETIAIIGNGPSAADVSPWELQRPGTHVIGLNRMWKWGYVDYLVMVDRGVWQEFQEYLHENPESNLLRSSWVVSWKFLNPKQNIPCVYSDTVYPMSRASHISPNPVDYPISAPWLNGVIGALGFPRIKTSVVLALHLALIMGARRVELYGCEGKTRGEDVRLGGEKLASCDPSDDRETALERIHEVVEQLYRDWHHKIEMVNRSTGYEGIWPTK